MFRKKNHCHITVSAHHTSFLLTKSIRWLSCPLLDELLLDGMFVCLLLSFHFRFWLISNMLLWWSCDSCPIFNFLGLPWQHSGISCLPSFSSNNKGQVVFCSNLLLHSKNTFIGLLWNKHKASCCLDLFNTSIHQHINSHLFHQEVFHVKVSFLCSKLPSLIFCMIVTQHVPILF